MPTSARDNAAIVSAVLRLLIYATFIGVTIYYGSKLTLRGRTTAVLLSLLHSLVFSVVYESCVRWQYCSIDLNVFRTWGSAIAVHFIVAWVLCLRGFDLYISDLQSRAAVAELLLDKAINPPPVSKNESEGDEDGD